ncbi:MAG: endonuclease MutS2 [Anaerolineales bacterium]
MDTKTLHLLEYPKVLEQLAKHTAFEASRQKALNLLPTADLREARDRLALTSEARRLLDTNETTIGGARDVRAAVDACRRGFILDPQDLLDVKHTLIAARTLLQFFERIQKDYPRLYDLAAQIVIPPAIINDISRTLSERGEVLDSASQKLESLRREARVIHDRLLTKLQRMVSDSRFTPYLQESLVTQRDGRYVIPLRSEFKGRIKAIIHDQSASGATLFIEPLGVVEMNNQHREIILAERDEIRRILSELSLRIGGYADEILHTVEVVADLDLAFAAAKYAYQLHASEPSLYPFDTPKDGSKHPGSRIRLYNARHPLLNPTTVVPIDVELDPQTYALVITGPNTGGKTVSLKTVGLLILMAQTGLHLPAQSHSELSVFESIYADIGDEQSIEQSLSTFSGHITNIIRILNEADTRSLIILDELGAGTDPQEGAALARALLSHLLSRGITTLVTTHHPELKAYAHATPGVVNASVEFDLQSLRPTYRLTIGLPGRSNALAIAARLGLPEDIIRDARSELSPEDLRAESLLDEIHRQRDAARTARAQAEQAREESQKLQQQLALRLEKIEDERLKILEQTRQESQSQLEALQTELADLRRSLTRARQPLEALTPLVEKIEAIEEQISEAPSRQTPADFGIPAVPTAAAARPVMRVGAKVRLKNLGAQGVITALSEDEAEVQVGVLRVRARLSDLETGAAPEAAATAPIRRRSKPEPAAAPPQAAAPPESSAPASPGMELDLRGQRVDDALDALDRYLDSAYLAGLPWARIIHGKGTGRLREAIRQDLQNHPHIHSFEAGGEKEGGEGVTVVKFRH